MTGDEDTSARYEEAIAHLRAEKSQLTEQLRDVRIALKQQSEGWQNEHNKRLALMFSTLNCASKIA